MQEGWAGSCKVNGLHSLCVKGKQGVARAEDQAVWEEILAAVALWRRKPELQAMEVVSESMW